MKLLNCNISLFGWLPIALLLSLSGGSVRAQHSCGVAHHIDELRKNDNVAYQAKLANYTRFVDRALVRGAHLKSGSGDACPNGITVLPIAFHVFHDGTAEGQGYNFSREDLALVVDGLNTNFSGYNADKNKISREFSEFEGGHTCIQFAIAKINRISTKDCSYWKPNATHADLHKCLPGGSGVGSQNDPNDYLNIYITKLSGGMLGVASSIPPLFGSANSDDDGVTMNRDIVVPGKSIYARYNQGSVLAHEVGHWLGLPHVNGDINGKGCQADDGFSDTYPQVSQQFFDCHQSIIPKSCSSVDNVFNFMDYSADCAKLMFTEQQISTMHAVLATERSGLASSFSRGNHNANLYKFQCRIFDANSRLFEYEIMDCHGEVNFLAYQTKWYPSIYNSDNPSAGLTKFTWKETTNKKAVKNVKKKHLAKYVITHNSKTYTDVRVYKLYMQCWNPYKNAYSSPQLAGKVMTILKACKSPDNDLMDKAEEIAINQNCHKKSYSLNNATVSQETVSTPCATDKNANDVWFSTKISSNTGLSLSVDGLDGDIDPLIQVFTLENGYLNCAVSQGSSTADITSEYAGKTLYIRVYSPDNAAKLFSICASETTLSNDEYNNAVELTVTEKCETPKIFSNHGATPSTHLSSAALCGRNDRADDVWFSATMPTTGMLTVESSKVDGGVSAIIMEAYVMINGNLHPVACSSIKKYWPSYDRHAHVEITDQAPGTKIYLRVFVNGPLSEGEFGLCAYSGTPKTSCRISYIEKLEQSECDGVSNTYSQKLRVHYRSNYMGDYLYVNNQKFRMTGSPQIITLTDLPSNNRSVNVSANIGRSAANSCWETSFYKTYKLFKAPSGCLQNALVNDDCVGAIELTVGSECHSTIYSSTGATYSSNSSAYFSCGVSGFRPDDVWFKVRVPQTGTVTISAPLLFNENNMILEAYSGSCDQMTLVGCDQFSGKDGSEIVLTDRTPDEWIYIRVADQGNNTQGDFAMCAYDHAPTGMYAGATTAADEITIYEAEQAPTSTDVSVSVYPNPAVDYINVHTATDKASASVRVDLLAADGKIISQHKAHGSSSISMDVTDLPTGLYFVRHMTDVSQEVHQVMVHR